MHQLHDRKMDRVTETGTVSEAFVLTNGVNPHCVLAPTLFNLMFYPMLMDAYRGERPGLGITYRTDRHLHNSRHMRTATLSSTTAVRDLLPSDNCALNTTSEEDKKRITDLLAAGCANSD
ncbi:hypothetical protein SprV_0902758000 [Sparganum proliferum]